MPTELSELLGGERWLEVEINDVTFNVAYRLNNTSLAQQAKRQKLMRLVHTDEIDEEDQAAEFARLFCEVVCDWDLVSGGNPLPLTPEVVAQKLPGPAFNAVMEAIAEDGRAQQEEKKVLSVTSAATSPPRGKRVNSRNGTRTSELRGTWA